MKRIKLIAIIIVILQTLFAFSSEMAGEFLASAN
jgi:hypothetical protein